MTLAPVRDSLVVNWTARLERLTARD